MDAKTECQGFNSLTGHSLGLIVLGHIGSGFPQKKVVPLKSILPELQFTTLDTGLKTVLAYYKALENVKA